MTSHSEPRSHSRPLPRQEKDAPLDLDGISVSELLAHTRTRAFQHLSLSSSVMLRKCRFAAVALELNLPVLGELPSFVVRL